MDVLAISETLELTKITQKPENWIELPDHIWIRVMQLLPGSDLNSMHLICKRLNEMASNFVPHKLVIGRKHDEVFRENEDPVRYFDEILIVRCDYSFIENNIQRLARIMEKIGVHVKKLIARDSYCTRRAFLKLLTLLPNLAELKIVDFGRVEREPAVEKVELPKIKTLMFHYSFNDNEAYVDFDVNPEDPTMEDFVVNNLEVPALEDCEAQVQNTRKLVPFLKLHQKTLKKLIINNTDMSQELLDFFGSADDMRLVSLNTGVGFKISDPKLLKFLGQQQATLKTLTLRGYLLSAEEFNFICESLTNLESLNLEFQATYLTTESTDNLCKLKNLKELAIAFYESNFNFLSGLGLSVNQNLHSLEAKNFQWIPASFIQTLPAFIPNLRTLKIDDYPCKSVDLLKVFESVVYLELGSTYSHWTQKHRLVHINNVVAKNLKHLKITYNFVLDPPTAAKIARDYPNLETIHITEDCQLMEESVEILLKNLKELKDFYVKNCNASLSQEILLMHINNYGKKLTRFAVEKVDFDFEKLREVWKDFENFEFSASSEHEFQVEF